MDSAQRVAIYESGERFDTEAKLANRQTAFRGQAAVSETFEVMRQVLLGAVDDPQIFTTATFDRGLQ